MSAAALVSERPIERRSVALGLCATILLGCRPSSAPSTGASFAIRVGDLLFQDLDCGPLCEAIEKVTWGARGAKLSHVAMVTEVGASPRAIEAYALGVAEVGLEELLSRSRDGDGRPKVLVGRLGPAYTGLIPAAVRAARGRLGKPYDEAFLMNNGAYYCSELLYEAFLEANGGSPVFDLQPMTFQDPVTGKTSAVWAEYFQKRGEPVPEGSPGLNPGGMSTSPALAIVHAFGAPEGWG